MQMKMLQDLNKIQLKLRAECSTFFYLANWILNRRKTKSLFALKYLQIIQCIMLEVFERRGDGEYF